MVVAIWLQMQALVNLAAGPGNTEPFYQAGFVQVARSWAGESTPAGQSLPS